MTDKFLLNTPVAEQLYFNVASKLPIIDYHNHLSVRDISENRRFENIYTLWIECDPYKHRAMRILGIDEEYITGSKTPYEKFLKWASALPDLVGNPIYHWAEMELSTVFGIDKPLNPDTAPEIWNLANEKLAENGFCAGDILKKFNVEYIAPCSSVTDDLSVFLNINDFASPSLRGDDMVFPTCDFLMKLEEVSKSDIKNLDSYFSVLERRIVEFDKIGCKFSDHALDYGFAYCNDRPRAEKVFKDILNKKEISLSDSYALSSAVLLHLGTVYSGLGWTMQLHIGALRSTSDRLRKIAGPAGGYAAIGSTFDVSSVVSLINDIEKAPSGLPKILLFTLNPADNAVMSVLSGSFSGGSAKTVISQGPAWWWCDHIYGIKEVLENISSFGVLSAFIGMTTDSRSILSFVRHDYFRRILCDFIGQKVKTGEFPNDIKLLERIVKKICYENAKECIK